jgi:uncharacterized MnhB-related membrane protein
MTILIFFILIMLIITGTGVVLTKDPLPQSMVISFYGLMLTIFFLVLQAPDVALSEVIVSSVIIPLLSILALSKAVGKGAK